MEENENMKEFLIETYVEHLRITTHGEKAYQFSYKLRNYFSNSYYHEIIMTKVDQLYNTTSFPVGDVDQNRYHTCYNIMYLLYHADKEKFLNSSACSNTTKIKQENCGTSAFSFVPFCGLFGNFQHYSFFFALHLLTSAYSIYYYPKKVKRIFSTFLPHYLSISRVF